MIKSCRNRDNFCPVGNITLTNFETMLDVAMDSDTITQADADTLQQWHSDPENWTPAGFDAID